ncbi:MAG TPA: glycosyltransferase [Tepidisphaeraceae bacterium]|nr:glycosyltransferase [Tepidisphaeraceae bacterium]
MNSSRPPLRIVHYAPGLCLAFGGVVRAVLDCCGVLAARGNEMLLATHDSPDVPGDWNGSPGKPNVVQLPPPLRPNFLVSRQAVNAWQNLLTPGCIAHLHTPWTASNMQLARVCRRLGVPYIVSIHGMLDDWSMAQSRLKKRIFLLAGGRGYLNSAAKIHFTAAAERDQAAGWVDVTRAAVLPYLVDLEPFKLLAPVNRADVPTLLFLSRIHEKKGLHHLIAAAALLRDAGRNFRLIVAGSAAPRDRDYESSLHRLVADLKLQDHVRFVGLVTGSDKIALYQSADLFVLPTQQENFGLVLIEAMAAGTPVLTTRGTDIWREIASAGATICDESPAALSAAIANLLDDRPALTAAGRRGRQWVMQRFDEASLAAEYENLYADVIAAGRV